MSVDLPDYYFRTRDNGAAVFRVDTEDRQRPLSLEQIATVNIRNGDVKPQGGQSLSDADLAAIDGWMAGRQDTLAAREFDDILRSIDQLHKITQWAQSRAGQDELEQVTDTLLLAMHDLRTVLVRKKAARMKER